MGRALLGALLIVLAASQDAAADVAATDTRQAGDAAAAQEIDPRHSTARFIVHLRLPVPAEGRLTGVTGSLDGAAEGGWQVKVKINGRSLRFEGPRWMDRVTRSNAFLAVDRFPIIRFESDAFPDAVLRMGGPVTGHLTLRGLGRPVSFQLLPSACDHPGRDCDIQVRGTISRHAFGMTAHGAMVRDEVEVHIGVRLKPVVAAQ